MGGLIPNSPRRPEKCLNALRGVGRLQKAILNAREQSMGAGLMNTADERPCVGIQGCLNPLQIEYSCVRVVDNGFMLHEGMVANIENYGRVGIWALGRYADAYGVSVGVRFRYYDPKMLNVLSALRDQESIATGEQRNAPVS
jgi:hypothetical protein